MLKAQKTYQAMMDKLQKHSCPASLTPQFKGQKVIILEYGQLVPELIVDLMVAAGFDEGDAWDAYKEAIE